MWQGFTPWPPHIKCVIIPKTIFKADILPFPLCVEFYQEYWKYRIQNSSHNIKDTRISSLLFTIKYWWRDVGRFSNPEVDCSQTNDPRLSISDVLSLFLSQHLTAMFSSTGYGESFVKLVSKSNLTLSIPKPPIYTGRSININIFS